MSTADDFNVIIEVLDNKLISRAIDMDNLKDHVPLGL